MASKKRIANNEVKAKEKHAEVKLILYDLDSDLFDLHSNIQSTQMF